MQIGVISTFVNIYFLHIVKFICEITTELSLKYVFLFSFVSRRNAEKLFIRFIKTGVVIISALEENFSRRHTGTQHEPRFDQAFELNILIYGRTDFLIE